MIEKKLKELRERKGYSITELAKLAKVSKSYLSQIERGLQKNPSLNFLYKIAIPLETSIESLLNEEKHSNFVILDLDEEWKILITRAIKEGLRKDDFKDYLTFLKFQAWLNEQKR